MAPMLNNKGDDYVGIINGVDYAEWSPQVDRLIPASFSPESLAGKALDKYKLQNRFMLEENPEIPVIGVVSRFAEQKGLSLLAQAIEGIVNSMRVQFVILGSGDPALERFFGGLPARFPGRIGSFIGYNNEIAHWIEAGSDFFIMPSIYEPCGLNQIYSLRYGTLPIVRATGGLDDTVEQYEEATGGGTGFKFWSATPGAVYDTVGWAVSTWYDRPEHIAQMRQRAMAQDFSWERSAGQYEALYARAMANKARL
jgi:starch synthase